jgi:hypothetical protein
MIVKNEVIEAAKEEMDLSFGMNEGNEGVDELRLV